MYDGPRPVAGLDSVANIIAPWSKFHRSAHGRAPAGVSFANRAAAVPPRLLGDFDTLPSYMVEAKSTNPVGVDNSSRISQIGRTVQPFGLTPAKLTSPDARAREKLFLRHARDVPLSCACVRQTVPARDPGGTHWPAS